MFKSKKEQEDFYSADRYGVPFSNYPECPNGCGNGRVGRNPKKEESLMREHSDFGILPDWHCFKCHGTF